jgi:sporulation protein YqfC
LKNAKRGRPLTELLKLPAELIPGVPRLTLSGGNEVLIENHGGLQSYSHALIEVRGRNQLVQIRGQELELAAMNRTQMVIQGLIVAVELC